MAKGSRFPHGEDAKVREMRTAETILNIIQDRGKRKLPLDDVYRQLYNPDMYLRAYAKLYRNDGRNCGRHVTRQDRPSDRSSTVRTMDVAAIKASLYRQTQRRKTTTRHA